MSAGGRLTGSSQGTGSVFDFFSERSGGAALTLITTCILGALAVLLTAGPAPAQPDEDSGLTPVPGKEYLYPGRNPDSEEDGNSGANRDRSNSSTGQSGQNRSSTEDSGTAGRDSSESGEEKNSKNSSDRETDNGGSNAAGTAESPDGSNPGTWSDRQDGGQKETGSDGERGSSRDSQGEEAAIASTYSGDRPGTRPAASGGGEGADSGSSSAPAPDGANGASSATGQNEQGQSQLGLNSDTQLDTEGATSPAQTQQPPDLETGSPLSDWSLTRGIAAVFIVLGLVLLLGWLIKKLRSGGGLNEGGPGLEVLEALSLGGGKQVMVLRTRDEDLLLGVTDEQITLLSRRPRGHTGGEDLELDSDSWRTVEEEERALAEDDDWSPEPRAERDRWDSSRVLEESEIYGEGTAEGRSAERPDAGQSGSGSAGERFLSELRDKLDEWEP